MSDALKKECDLLYQIPIVGQAESLNVSVAAGIVMYQLVK
jgi:tRNA G18 (ribose-2'-O)-methylase SpoU